MKQSHCYGLFHKYVSFFHNLLGRYEAVIFSSVNFTSKDDKDFDQAVR